MEEIENEVMNKMIEKPKFEVVKEKKPRSQAQKESFEKARKKRAENLAKKKELEKKAQSSKTEDRIDEIVSDTLTGLEGSDGKVQSPVPKGKAKRGKGRPKGSKNKKVMKREPEPIPNYPQSVSHEPYRAVNHNIPYQNNFAQQSAFHPQNFAYPQYQQPPQVHNYYYGAHQQPASESQSLSHPYRENLRRTKSPPPPHSSSEEEEHSSEEEYPRINEPVEPQQDSSVEQLKYRFA